MKVSYVTDEKRDALLTSLMTETGVKTKQELIDNAVVAFEWLVEQKQKGRLIISTDNQGSERELVMPVLTHVRRKVQDEEILE